MGTDDCPFETTWAADSVFVDMGVLDALERLAEPIVAFDAQER